MKYTVMSTEYGLMTGFTLTYDEAATLLSSINPNDAGSCWIVSDDPTWNLQQYVNDYRQSRYNLAALFCFLFISFSEIERVFIGVWSLRSFLSSLSYLLKKEAPNSKAPLGAYMGGDLALWRIYHG